MAPPDFAGHVGRSSRSHSISSDRTSLTGFGSLLSPPKEVTPDPAFIAASAASQIVTNDHDSLADTWFDQHGIEPSGETALVAPPALKLVNRFLDQLLFNFLSISKSTSLGALRPAVSEVLKPKLAKGAINGAEQELHEYLGGGEDEDLLAFHSGLEPSHDWDLELVWKRTRLRCMVYSSLGDMEEEDEDYYTEQEQLDGPSGSNSNRYSNTPGVVSPAVAIFLTSILEYMGEQVLIVAGQAAYHRLRSKHERAEREGTDTPSEIADRVVVEEADMERVALDRTLGRLWRGWKKRIRSPTNSISMARSFSRESLTSPPQGSRATSLTPEEIISEDITSLATVLAEYEQASFIPLPMTDDDVREIEIPGLAKQIDDDEEKDASADEQIPMKLRPTSMLAPKSTESSEAASTQSPNSRMRRNSLPHPAKAPYSSPPIAELPSGEDGEAEDVEEKEPGESVATENGLNEPEVIKEEKATSDDHKGLVAGVIATAAAVSAAAVAGVVAVAKGEAPQTALEASKEETDTEEDFTEEAQIMTSSRVSIGGMTPDELKGLSRQSSVRSPSVHSLRLIDVSSAKSSTGRSRNDSVDAGDYISNGRPRVSSRPSSINSPVLDTQSPRVVSPGARGANSSPVIRNGSSLSARQSARDSIIELEEKEAHEAESEPKTAVQADIARSLRGSDMDPSPTSSQFTADSKAAIPQNSTFVLSAPPAARSLRDAPTSHPSEHIIQQSSTPTTARTPGVDSGVPPLTPLREMMEGAADTSDEASSVAPSNDAQSMSEYGVRGHASSDSTSTIPKSRRVPEQERSIQPQIINSLRSSPPRASRDEAARKIATEPKSQRSLHTSGSGSSSNSHKIKPVRTSQESTSTVAEDKGRSFEQLIRSDQTIQYTLTPQNMRNIEGPEFDRYANPAATTNVNEVQRPKTSRSHSSSVSKLTGSQLQSAVETPKAAQPFKAIPRPTSNAGSRLRANAPQPRDARVDRDSIGDFADFIRSTGPVESYERAPPRSAPGHRGANGVARNGSASSPRSAATSSSTLRRTESAAGRSKLQARDAVVTRGDSISDLIDFVRSGPQLSKEDHRIPRTVAPFRTTMDSDQMSGAIGGRAIDASLPDPRFSQASTSAHNSVNSQSALLTNASKNKPLPVQSQNGFEGEEDMMPKRKTRRVRDPYAIDFSDDEEEYEAAPKPRATQEESLADFLRNVPPPPDSTVTPIYVPDKNVRKKSSKSQLMSRFGRNGSGPQSPPKPDVTSQAARTQQPRQLYTPIAAKYSTTMNFNQPSPQSNSYVSQLDTARNTTRNTTRNVSQIPSRPKVAHQSYQPREAVSSSSRTNDLADFLKRSEPPSSVPQTHAPTVQKEEASTFQRMFGRKKVA